LYEQPRHPRQASTVPKSDVTDFGADALASRASPHAVESGALKKQQPGPASSYDGAFRAAYDRLAAAAGHLEHSRLTAASLLAELWGNPRARRALLLHNSSRFRSWGLAEQVLTRASETWGEEADQAIELAELALDIVDQLYGLHGAPVVDDLAGRAWSHWAMAHLSAGHPNRAQSGFERAWERIEAGTGDPFEQAQLLDLQVAHSLATDNLPLALEQLNRIESALSRIEEPLMTCRTLLRKADLQRRGGSPGKALRTLRRAAKTVQSLDAPDLHLQILRAEIAALHQARRPQEGWDLLPNLRRWTLHQGDWRDLLELRRLDALLAEHLGYRARAEASWVEVYRLLRDQEGGIEAALACLGLAAFHLRHDQAEKVGALAAPLLALQPAEPVAAQFRVAVAAFVAASQECAVTREIVQQTLEQLEQLTLGFVPAGPPGDVDH